MDVLVSALPYIQIVLSALLVVAVLLQQSDAGLGSAFGGGDNVTQHTRRGFEKFLFYGTIVIGILFALSALAAIVLR